MSTIRTTKHDYPREEVNAMTRFYGGKVCVITKLARNVQWAHIMDAALPASTVNFAFLESFQHSDVNYVPISSRRCSPAS